MEACAGNNTLTCKLLLLKLRPSLPVSMTTCVLNIAPFAASSPSSRIKRRIRLPIADCCHPSDLCRLRFHEADNMTIASSSSMVAILHVLCILVLRASAYVAFRSCASIKCPISPYESAQPLYESAVPLNHVPSSPTVISQPTLSKSFNTNSSNALLAIE